MRSNRQNLNKKKSCQIINLYRKFKWQDRDLNPGHKDFQSSALPTELSRRDCVFDQTRAENNLVWIHFKQALQEKC